MPPWHLSGTIKEQLQTAKDGLKAFEGVDIAQLQGQITQLQNDLTAKETAHQAQLAQMAFDRDLDTGITAARGRNGKAIRALLDLEALQGSQNREKDIKTALDTLKQENAYLFDEFQFAPRERGDTWRIHPQRARYNIIVGVMK